MVRFRPLTWLFGVGQVWRGDELGSGPFRPGRPLRLRSYLLALVVVALLPALAVSINTGIVAERAASEAHRQSLTANARALAAAEDAEFAHAFRAIGALASRAGDDPSRLPADFPELLHEAAEISGALVTLRTPGGAALVSSIGDAARMPLDPTWKALARLAVRTGSLAIGDVSVAQGTSMPVVPLLMPVLHDGEPVFMVEMLLPSDRLIGALRQRGQAMEGETEGGLAVLVDPEQRVAAASYSVAQLVGQIYPAASPGGTAPASASLQRAPGWRVLYSEGNSPPPPLPRRATPGPMAQAMLAAAFALLLGLAVVMSASRHLTDWLRQLTEMTRGVAVGNNSLREPLSRMAVAEFEELRHSLTRAEAVLRRRASAERMALREARTGHELLMSVVNATPEAIRVKDLTLRYVLVNHAALQAGDGKTPLAEWQMLGRRAAELYPPEFSRRIEAADRRVLATGETESFELNHTHFGGTTPVYSALTVAPWRDAKGCVVGVVTVSREVTQQRQAEMRLRKLQAELLRATRLSAMGAMASGLAHELNQPLAAAVNYLNAGTRLLERNCCALLGRKGCGDTAALVAARAAVGDAAQQMLRAGAIVRRLRDFVGRGEVELQPEKIAELLYETRDLAITGGHTEGIGLQLQIQEEMGPALIDRTQIGQVLFNLIRNAAEAIQSTPSARPGHILVSTRIDADGCTLIEVTDNGPGLAPGIADRLFEPFVSSKRSGMGIGLSICRTIVEGHGGELTAIPNPSGGMTFRISLPALSPQGVAA